MKKLHSLVLLIAIVLSSCSNKVEKVIRTDYNNSKLKSGGIKFKAPPGWLGQKPSSNMKLAQFKLPGANGAGDAELSVYFFPGQGGSIDANLNRWFKQFKAPEGSLPRVKTQMNINGIPTTIIYTYGTYFRSIAPMMPNAPKQELPGHAMLAAIAETADGPWFFKSTGPKATIDYWKPAFNDFVDSFEIKG